jgi:hypothetical protein
MRIESRGPCIRIRGAIELTRPGNPGYPYDENPKIKFPSGRQVGFIAQEVEQVLPEVVHTDGAGYRSVAYQNMTALLVEAMKRQQTQIDELRATVQRLQQRLQQQLGGKGSVGDQPSHWLEQCAHHARAGQ